MKTILLSSALFVLAAGASCSKSQSSSDATSGTDSTSASTGSTSASTGSTTSMSAASSSSASGGGNGGAGGAGGTTSSSSSTSGTGGAGGGCVWSANNNPCGNGRYCSAPDCNSGQCEAVPAMETADKMMVCGCDGEAYWNPSVAASHGVPATNQKPSQCMHTCGGFANLMCSKSESCDYVGMDANVCNVSDVGGFCVQLPKSCAGGNAKGHACGGMCADECSLVQQSKVFYPDANCP